MFKWAVTAVLSAGASGEEVLSAGIGGSRRRKIAAAWTGGYYHEKSRGGPMPRQSARARRRGRQAQGNAQARPELTDLVPRILTGHEGQVHSVAVLPDGRRALSGSGDRTLRLWDLQTGATIRILKGHTNEVNDVRG